MPPTPGWIPELLFFSRNLKQGKVERILIEFFKFLISRKLKDEYRALDMKSFKKRKMEQMIFMCKK